MTEVFVKVEIKNKMDVKITMYGESWTYEDFLLSIGIHADISAHDIKYICDSCGIVIPKADFVKIFFQNYIHPEYFLKLKIKNETEEAVFLKPTPEKLTRQNCFIGHWYHDMYINKEELEKHILQSSNAYVLMKKNNPKEQNELADLSDVERRAVIREGVGLLVQKFSYHPEHDHKLALAIAIIKLFPQLDTHNKDTGGTDLLYNREENRGYILNRLNHIRNKLYKIESNSDENCRILKKKQLNVMEKEIHKNKQVDLVDNSTSSINEDLIILKNLSTVTQKEFLKEKLTTTTISILYNLLKI